MAGLELVAVSKLPAWVWAVAALGGLGAGSYLSHPNRPPLGSLLSGSKTNQAGPRSGDQSSQITDALSSADTSGGPEGDSIDAQALAAELMAFLATQNANSSPSYSGTTGSAPPAPEQGSGAMDSATAASAPAAVAAASTAAGSAAAALQTPISSSFGTATDMVSPSSPYGVLGGFAPTNPIAMFVGDPALAAATGGALVTPTVAPASSTTADPTATSTRIPGLQL